MQAAIIFFIENFTLSFFLLSLIFGTASILCCKNQLSKVIIIDKLFAYFLLFNIGFSYLYNFMMHVFFGNIAAAFIGWSPSPFQLEVGFASLGFGVIGIISFWSSIGFRAATMIAPALFLWGAAGGHIYQMITADNFSAGNAGIIFYSDLLIPIFGFILLYLQYANSSAKPR
ncbi:MAG: hypothetical protein CMF49_08510 [Legionellales bacterium]|nr:hypothetical protein [Legionellales bacterium]|tara:strand:- start:97 stop:612 length:516 start_codon:yes stop_codon:yes gene_type:complete